VSKSTSLSQH